MCVQSASPIYIYIYIYTYIVLEISVATCRVYIHADRSTCIILRGGAEDVETCIRHLLLILAVLFPRSNCPHHEEKLRSQTRMSIILVFGDGLMYMYMYKNFLRSRFIMLTYSDNGR